MKKRTFLNRLKKEIIGRPADEVEDIVLEYSSYIDDRIKKGLSEEDAVATFGNVSELASELSKNNEIQERDPIGDAANKVILKIERIINNISKKSGKEIAKIIGEVGIFIIIIGILHFPITLLTDLGKDVFYILPSPVNRLFFHSWRFILELSYFVFAIVISLRCLDHFDDGDEKYKEQPKKNKKQLNISKMIIDVLVFIMKMISIFMLLGVSMYILCMSVVLVVCIYLFLHGVTYYGFYLVMITLLLIGILFFSLLYDYVIDKKNNLVFFLLRLACCFILLSLGCGIAAVEITDTEFINGPPDSITTEVLQEELIMNRQTVFVGNIADYKIDNNIKNVLVEFHYYPIANQISTNIKKEDNNVYLDWHIESVYLKPNLVKDVIKHLAEKKVYNYYLEPIITITSNEENINIIKQNRMKYYHQEKNYSSCSFTRTYYVEMIRNTKDEKSYVVLSENGNDEIATVELDNQWINSLEVGLAYEITFKTYQRYVDTDINSIFLENEIEGIKKTDKPVEEHIQEQTCSIFY